jgi:hypothetical protein
MTLFSSAKYGIYQHIKKDNILSLIEHTLLTYFISYMINFLVSFLCKYSNSDVNVKTKPIDLIYIILIITLLYYLYCDPYRK